MALGNAIILQNAKVIVIAASLTGAKEKQTVELKSSKLMSMLAIKNYPI